MDQVSRNILINSITGKYLYTRYVSKIRGIIDCFLYHPSANDRVEADYWYSYELKNAISKGMMTNEQILNCCKSIGTWDDASEYKIKKLHDDIYNLKKSLIDLLLNKKKLEKYRRAIRDSEKELMKCLTYKYKLTKESAESYASSRRDRFLMHKIAMDVNKNQIWRTIDDLDNEIDVNFVLHLMSLYFDNSKLPDDIIRCLCRSEEWRCLWKSSKSGTDIFGVDGCDFSNNQIDMMRWSLVYDGVYESVDRPSDQVINDDDLLDSWMIKQSEKIKHRSDHGVIDARSGKPQKGKREIFVLTDKDSVQDVYSMNDPLARARIKAKDTILNKSGSLPDQMAPDSQEEMRNTMAEKIKSRRKSISGK